jgi:hypothetical protein
VELQKIQIKACKTYLIKKTTNMHHACLDSDAVLDFEDRIQLAGQLSVYRAVSLAKGGGCLLRTGASLRRRLRWPSRSRRLLSENDLKDKNGA